jgi:hypothetical protein
MAIDIVVIFPYVNIPEGSNNYLVGGFSHLEKYEGQLGRIIPYIMENKFHV